MDTTLSQATTQLIQASANTAHNVIHAYRQGGERLGDALEQRYVSALRKAAKELAPEVRENALVTQKIVSAYYAKGVTLATAGAGAMVDNVVKYTGMGVEQIAAGAALLEGRTGFTGLKALAAAAVPAALAAGEVAAQLERKSAALAGRPTARTSAFRKARSRKA